jgi:hypothetical protein
MTRENQKHNSQKNRNNTGISSPRTEHNASDTPEETAERNNKKDESRNGFWKRLWNETPTSVLLTGTTIILMLATVVLAYFTYGLVSDSKEQTKQFVQQVNIAKSALTLNDSSVKMELRPFILYDWKRIGGSMTNDYHANLFVWFSNAGKTPAINVRGNSGFHLGYKGLKEFTDSIKISIVTKGADMGIGDSSRIANGEDFKVTDFSTKNNGSIVNAFSNCPLFFFARITYEDFFGEHYFSDICISMPNTIKPKAFLVRYNDYCKYR